MSVSLSVSRLLHLQFNARLCCKCEPLSSLQRIHVLAVLNFSFETQLLRGKGTKHSNFRCLFCRFGEQKTWDHGMKYSWLSANLVQRPSYVRTAKGKEFFHSGCMHPFSLRPKCLWIWSCGRLILVREIPYSAYSEPTELFHAADCFVRLNGSEHVSCYKGYWNHMNFVKTSYPVRPDGFSCNLSFLWVIAWHFFQRQRNFFWMRPMNAPQFCFACWNKPMWTRIHIECGNPQDCGPQNPATTSWTIPQLPIFFWNFTFISTKELNLCNHANILSQSENKTTTVKNWPVWTDQLYSPQSNLYGKTGDPTRGSGGPLTHHMVWWGTIFGKRVTLGVQILTLVSALQLGPWVDCTRVHLIPKMVQNWCDLHELFVLPYQQQYCALRATRASVCCTVCCRGKVNRVLVLNVFLEGTHFSTHSIRQWCHMCFCFHFEHSSLISPFAGHQKGGKIPEQNKNNRQTQVNKQRKTLERRQTFTDHMLMQREGCLVSIPPGCQNTTHVQWWSWKSLYDQAARWAWVQGWQLST